MKSVLKILCETVAKSLNEYISRHDNVESFRVLRDEQISVFKKIRNLFLRGEYEGYVKLPTGVGKTVLFIEFLKAVNLRSIVVVPTNILVKQTQDRMLEFAQDIDVGIVNANHKQYGKTVTITTYASLVAQTKSGKIDPIKYDCLILDEAHKALASKSTQAIKAFENAIKLGFTATSDYSEEKRLLNLLPNEIANMPVRSAIEDGLLAGCSVILAQTKVDLSSVPTSQGNYRERELALAVDIAERNIGAVKIFQRFFLEEMAVVYCVGIQHAGNLASIFYDHGIVARAISGKNSQRERSAILKDFSDGVVKILCNADLLIHGFDEPKASVCINLRPTLSWVVATQRAGRVLRLNPANLDKMAYVVEFLDAQNKRPHQPITFVEILNGAIVLDSLKSIKNKGIVRKRLDSSSPHLDIDDIRVTIASHQVIRVVSSRRQQRSLRKNWLGNLALRSKLQEAFQDIFQDRLKAEFYGDFLANLRDLNPRFFSEHEMLHGIIRWFHDPQLVSLISDELKNMADVWFESKTLVNRFQTSRWAIQQLADSYSQREGDIRFGYINDECEDVYVPHFLFRTMRRGQWEHSKPTYHHPRLVRYIEKILSKQEQVIYRTEEWSETNTVIDLIQGPIFMPGTRSMIRRSMLEYIKENKLHIQHPFWFYEREKEDARGVRYTQEVYAPPLVKSIQKYFEQRLGLDKESFIEEALAALKRQRAAPLTKLQQLCKGNNLGAPSVSWSWDGPLHALRHTCTCVIKKGDDFLSYEATASKKYAALLEVTEKVFVDILRNH